MTTANKSIGGKAWISAGALTVFFVAAYFVLRALPDAECGFLHYEKIVHPDGTVEFCATNHAGFLDLTRLEYPVQTELSFESDLAVGVSANGTLKLETKGGMSIAPHELAITHTKLMHMMVIDPSLEDYHHIHPESDGFDGDYTFPFKPEKTGAYRFFTEVVPLVSRRQVLAVSTAEVKGVDARPQFSVPTREFETEGLRFRLKGLPDQLKVGRDYRFELIVTDMGNQPADLEIVMGAKAHMVAFDEARKGFAHMHPEASLGVASAGISNIKQADALGFVFNVPNPGWYRVFAQIQIDGEAVYGRFDCLVE